MVVQTRTRTFAPGVPKAAAKAAALPLPPLGFPADALLVRGQARAALAG